MADTKTFTIEEVAKHNKSGDLWVVIDSVVYDLSKFEDLHPGGGVVLRDPEVAGQECTDLFYQLHRHEVLEKYKRYIIGRIEGGQKFVVEKLAGDISTVPFAEPTWLQPAFSSPYYNEGHRKFQQFVRKFSEEEGFPEAFKLEEGGGMWSEQVIKRMVEFNLNEMRLGPGKHLHGLTLPTGLKGEDFDYFHELILNQELVRSLCRATQDGFFGGMVIGLPPVLNFANPQVSEEVFQGKKFICLAISEAFAGSDVAGLRCTATKTADGKHYIVNGTKKWITNGTFADYFVTGVRTDGGLSMLLIERGEGVETKPIKTSYSSTGNSIAGTAYVVFDNVKVPVENLLGEEHEGFKVILSNFNHERWVMTCATIRSSRQVVEECLKWVHQRKVFNKPLVAQPVIRNKLAKMISLCESHQAWLEMITFQMNKMNYREQGKHLAGQIALIKASSTRMSHYIADEAVQIFGGRGITKTGMGARIENFYRNVKFDAILGGSEEILMDLGIRQALRNMPKAML